MTKWIVAKWTVTKSNATKWAVPAATLLFASALAAQQSADMAAGKRLFEANCAVCHGVDGTGGTSPVNLARGEFKHGGSDAELFDTISKGVPGTEMPGSFLKPGEIRQVVEFVQALGNPFVSPGTGGDAGRGQELFAGSGGCAACHSVVEEGSHAGALFGPNLYGIGDRRSVEDLIDSIPRVHRGLAEFRWTVSAVKQSGEKVAGLRLNEDTYSIQLRDGENTLVSLLKKDLKELKVERSGRLPVFDDGLSASNVGDLAAYLATLRRSGSRP